MKRIVKVLFWIYIVVLIYILFLARFRVNYFSEYNIFSKEHLQMLNIVPFKTINSMINSYMNGSVNRQIVINNILINLLLFIPMGFFLPILFKDKFNNIWKILIFNIILISLIEIIQFITFTGSLDIDDLILNTISCIIGYLISKINFIRKMLGVE